MTRNDSPQSRPGRMISSAFSAPVRHDEGRWYMRTLQKKARKRRELLGKQGSMLRRQGTASEAVQTARQARRADAQAGPRLTDLFGLLSAYGRAAPPANEIHDAIAEAMEEQENRSRSSGPTS